MERINLIETAIMLSARKLKEVFARLSGMQESILEINANAVRKKFNARNRDPRVSLTSHIHSPLD